MNNSVDGKQCTVLKHVDCVASNHTVMTNGTPDRIEETKARCEAAISGEWTVATHQEYYGQGYGETTFFVDMGEGVLLKIGVADDSESFERLCALSAFIANARGDIPFLIGEIERLTKERDNALDMWWLRY